MKPVKMAKGGKVPSYLAAEPEVDADIVSQSLSSPS